VWYFLIVFPVHHRLPERLVEVLDIFIFPARRFVRVTVRHAKIATAGGGVAGRNLCGLLAGAGCLNFASGCRRVT
jgi:hypothetical protein